MVSATQKDQERYNVLKQSIAEIGPIRRGSVMRRLMPCGRAGCRCQATPPKLHGPYYDWTRKVKGKTVTVRLTKEEADLLREWIANGRKLNKIVAQMEKVSLRVTERMLRQARKRSKS